MASSQSGRPGPRPGPRPHHGHHYEQPGRADKSEGRRRRGGARALHEHIGQTVCCVGRYARRAVPGMSGQCGGWAVRGQGSTRKQAGGTHQVARSDYFAFRPVRACVPPLRNNKNNNNEEEHSRNLSSRMAVQCLGVRPHSVGLITGLRRKCILETPECPRWLQDGGKMTKNAPKMSEDGPR